jgi:cystathionine beta-lyase
VLASAAAFARGDQWLDDLVAGLESNLVMLRDQLASTIPRITMADPCAGYLAWLDCSALGLDREPAELFLQAGRVALSPGLSFGFPGAGYARLNFACSPDILTEAVSRMARTIGRIDC